MLADISACLNEASRFWHAVVGQQKCTILQFCAPSGLVVPASLTRQRAATAGVVRSVLDNQPADKLTAWSQQSARHGLRT